MPDAVMSIDSQIDEAQHDIGAIQKFIDGQGTSSDSREQVRLLVQLQIMYQHRVVFLQNASL